jgi:hypothetical protein
MLESALFDVARSLGPARPFMDDFGPAFEDYVGEVLADLGVPVVRERELADQLVGEGQVVDFATFSDDAVVLLDAKGLDPHYEELYHNLPSALAARMKTSLLKAVDQAIDTINRLPCDLQRDTAYFICVTFKQLAVGDGNALRELTRGTPEWDHDRWRSHVLSPAQMFFGSIQELETLVAYAQHSQLSAAAVLQQVALANAVPETRQALLELHLLTTGIELLAPACVQDAAARLRA